MQPHIRRDSRRHLAGLIWLTLGTLPALRADVTLRYKMLIDLNKNLPPQLTEQMSKQMNVSIPPAQTIQHKDGKVLSTTGNFSSLGDFNKHEITLIDTAGKRYGAISAGQFGEAMTAAMPEIPEQAKAAMAAMKVHSESKATGRTATIQGIEAEEREIDITIDAPPMPNVPPGPMMRMAMHLWTAKASEKTRVPAVAEFTNYDYAAMGGMDPLSAMSKVFAQMPGLGDAMADLMKQMKSGGTPMLLRMQIEMFMPMVTALLRQAPGANPSGAEGAAEAPILTMTNELAEISTAQIPDSVLQIPEGYKEVPAADILKDMVKEKTPPTQPPQ